MELNVYKVDYHLTVENTDGTEVVRPGSSTSLFVAAESTEAAIAGAAKDVGEGFEVEHVSNVCQDVLVVPAKKAAKPAAPSNDMLVGGGSGGGGNASAPADQKPATEKIQ